MAIEPMKPAHWPARPPFARTGSAMDLGRPTRVVARDGRSGIAVDPRVIVVRPELSDAEALVLDLALKTHDGVLKAEGSSEMQQLLGAVQALKDALDGHAAEKAPKTGGVRLAADQVAELTGLMTHEAAAVVATLVVKRLLIEERDALGMPDGWRPGPALTN